MDQKVLLVGFKGEKMCFVHALLNALDMQARGMDVKLIVEGAACGRIADLEDDSAKFADAWREVIDAGLLEGVCQACAHQVGSLDSAKRQNLPLLHEMSGHPALGAYVEQGYQVILF